MSSSKYGMSLKAHTRTRTKQTTSWCDELVPPGVDMSVYARPWGVHITAFSHGTEATTYTHVLDHVQVHARSHNATDWEVLRTLKTPSHWLPLYNVDSPAKGPLGDSLLKLGECPKRQNWVSGGFSCCFSFLTLCVWLLPLSLSLSLSLSFYLSIYLSISLSLSAC